MVLELCQSVFQQLLLNDSGCIFPLADRNVYTTRSCFEAVRQNTREDFVSRIESSTGVLGML